MWLFSVFVGWVAVLRGRLWQLFFSGCALAGGDEAASALRCTYKDVAVRLTSHFVVPVASPFAAGAQVQCSLLAACIRGAVDGLTSSPFLYYKG